MKKFLMALAAMALVASPALADTTIGVVNVAKLMNDSKAAQSVRTQLQGKQKDFQTQFDSRGKELLAERQTLEKEKDSVDKDAFAKKVQAFREKELDAQKSVHDKGLGLEKATNDALATIQQNIVDITKQLATERKLTMVLTSNQVLVSDASQDLTDEVMKRLDTKLPSVTVKFQ